MSNNCLSSNNNNNNNNKLYFIKLLELRLLPYSIMISNMDMIPLTLTVGSYHGWNSANSPEKKYRVRHS